MSVISDADRGLHYGDGLFETISCVQGRPRWLDRHLERLRSGCERLQIRMPDTTELRSQLAALAAGEARCLLKLIVTRGVATARGYRPSGVEISTVLMQKFPWPESAGTRAFAVDISPVTLGENPLLAGIKHLNRLEQVLAQQRMAAGLVAETLMLSTSGAVICGSMSNLFLCEESALITPGLESCGVAGVMRGLVIDAAQALQLPLRVMTISPQRLQSAPAAFLTNVRLGVQPIVLLAGRPLASDARSSRLQEWINAHAA
jgi:4-amino-4-deoxychorismate lyase